MENSNNKKLKNTNEKNMKKRFKKIYIEITNVCNLNCSFCTPTKRENKFMNVEEFEKIAIKIKDYTNLITLHVKGEPLMHKELDKILKIAYDNSLMVNITTNATLLNKNLNVILKSGAVRQLNLSLHSINQNAKLNTVENTNKYIKEIFKAVDIIKEKTNIYISYRLWNLNNLQESTINTNILKTLEEKYLINNLIEKAKINKTIKLEENIYLNQDIEFVWPSIENKKISDTGKCYGLRNQLAILSNGDIVPCCLDQDANIKLGNIFEIDSIDTILNSDKAKKIIEGFKNNKCIEQLCSKCGYISRFK